MIRKKLEIADLLAQKQSETLISDNSSSRVALSRACDPTASTVYLGLRSQQDRAVPQAGRQRPLRQPMTAFGNAALDSSFDHWAVK
jgi:hypothetical protein